LREINGQSNRLNEARNKELEDEEEEKVHDRADLIRSHRPPNHFFKHTNTQQIEGNSKPKLNPRILSIIEETATKSFSKKSTMQF